MPNFHYATLSKKIPNVQTSNNNSSRVHENIFSILHVCAKFCDPVSKYLKRSLPKSTSIVSSICEQQPAHLFTSTAKSPEKTKFKDKKMITVTHAVSILSMNRNFLLVFLPVLTEVPLSALETKQHLGSDVLLLIC